jgi:hypothetical protein
MQVQMGLALAEIGHLDASVKILLYLTRKHEINEPVGELLTTLVFSGYEKEAGQIYKKLVSPPDLSPGIAARVLNGFLKSGSDAPPDMTRHLLTIVFGLNEQIAAFQQFGEQLSDPDFWHTDLGKKTRETLQWYTLPITGTDSKGQPTEPDRSLVASQLGVPVETVQFGPELVTNGGFEHYEISNDLVSVWHHSFMSRGNPRNLAAFVVGVDSSNAWNGSHAMRVDGLYRENNPELKGARAGFWHREPITVQPDTSYVVSFAYRTQEVQGNVAAVWLTGEQNVFWKHEKRLPPTGGEWKHETFVVWNRSGNEARIRPLLRSWGEGSVWFDDFSIRQVV